MLAAELFTTTLKPLLKDRVYPGRLPDSNKTWPAAKYQLVSTVPVNAMDAGYIGTREVIYELAIYATTREGARQTADAAIGLLTQQANLVCLYRGDTETFEPDVRLHGRLVEFSIWEENTI